MPASKSPSRLGLAVVQIYILIRPLLPSAGVAKFALFVPKARQQVEFLLFMDRLIQILRSCKRTRTVLCVNNDLVILLSTLSVVISLEISSHFVKP